MTERQPPNRPSTQPPNPVASSHTDGDAHQTGAWTEAERTVGDQRATGAFHDPQATAAEHPGPLAAPPSERDLYPKIPGYDIEGILGHGGMGVVYRAHHRALKRTVALKVTLAGGRASAQDLARFQSEAEAVARLQHPNIVQVYDVGQADGLPYFALEFVSGGSLYHKLAGKPMPPRASAQLLETLAHAIEHAHSQGIVHRDLKPANVLLTEAGIPKVSDFGLAKRLEEDSGQTSAGTILGTPSYMAPEQATGLSNEAGPAVDIYALGVILYEMLTGRPPFSGPTVLDTLEQVRTREPVPPSRLQQRVPRDLETICLKCLHKLPAGRYANAGELAEDLRRFLADEPIRARPVSQREKLWRWCRRNPWLAATATIAGVCLLAALILPTFFALQLNDALKVSDRDRKEKQKALGDAFVVLGLTATDLGRPAEASLWFANASKIAGDDIERRELNRLRVRTWTESGWTLVRMLPHSRDQIMSMSFHPNGRYLLTRQKHDICSVWDLEREERLTLPGDRDAISAMCWSPAGDLLALATPGSVDVLRFPSLESVQQASFTGKASALKFNADGRYLAVGSDRLRIWSLIHSAWLPGEAIHTGAILAITFSPRDGLVATGDDEGNKARLFKWNSQGLTDKPILPPIEHYTLHCQQDSARDVLAPDHIFPPLFAMDGRQLLTHTRKEMQCWDTETGKQADKVESAFDHLHAFELSPNSNWAAMVFNGEPRFLLRQLEKQQSWPIDLRYDGLIWAEAFGPSGGQVFLAGDDRHFRQWSLDPRMIEPVADTIVGEDIWRLAISVDGGLLATASPSGLVRIWASPRPVMRFESPANFQRICYSNAISPDGSYLLRMAPSPEGEIVQVHELASGKPTEPPMKLPGNVVSASFSSDGNQVATTDFIYAGKPGMKASSRLSIWDWRTGKRLFEPIILPIGGSRPQQVAYRPDGRQIVVIADPVLPGDRHWLLAVDPALGKIKRRVEIEDSPAMMFTWQRQLQFTTDSRTLVTAGTGASAEVWDADTLQLRYPPLKHGQACVDIDIAPDGRTLVSASYDGTARLWDLETGAPRGQPLAHADWVFQARFSRDGRYIVTGSRDRLVRIWDAATGELACPPLEHKGAVLAADFSPDGRWVFTIADTNSLRIWDRATGKPVTNSLPLENGVSSLRATNDGRSLILSGEKHLQIRDLSDLTEPWLPEMSVDDLCSWTELLSSKRLVANGAAADLSPQELLERWRAFRAAHPGFPPLRRQ